MNPPNNEKHAFLFAGGGTGGHIYPALAIIEHIRDLDPHAHCELLVSDRPNDRTILQPLSVPFAPLPAKPFITRPKPLLKFLRAWPPSVRQTRDAIRRLKRSHNRVTLVAMGGFVAAPAARAAHRERIRVVLVNLDAVPGKANELIARKAHSVFTVCEIQGHPRWTRVPPIVRAAAETRSTPAQAREHFDLDPDSLTLLVTGGSSGARSINRFMHAFAQRHPEPLAGWQVIHQTGAQIGDDELKDLRAAYAHAGVNAWTGHYIHEMGHAYAAADLIIARCGAGTVAECLAARIPALFFPFPHHTDQHQLHNARPLLRAEGAIACTDHVDPQRNLHAYADILADLLTNPQRRERMRDALEALGRPEGAARIAEALINAR